MTDHIVIEDASGLRATVSIDALHDHELRGFTAIGKAIAAGDPRTEAEAAKDAADQAAAQKAARDKFLAPKKPQPKKES